MRVVLSLVFALALAITPSRAQKLVYPPSDAAADIASALAKSKADGKHVLIDFGADWCPDCRVLATVMEDPAVAPFLESNFHVVHVDVGRRDKNGDLAEKYGATSAAWIPAVVVLDGGGKTVGFTDEKVRLTRRDTPQTLLPILQAWSPKSIVATAPSFTERAVRVSVALERDAIGGLWLTATFAPVDPDVHVYATDLPADGIDGMGRPTIVSVADDATSSVTGPRFANRPVILDRIEALGQSLPIYPAGAVTLRQRVVRRESSGNALDVRVSYMGCGPQGCLPPVSDRRVRLTAPAGAQ